MLGRLGACWHPISQKDHPGAELRSNPPTPLPTTMTETKAPTENSKISKFSDPKVADPLLKSTPAVVKGDNNLTLGWIIGGLVILAGVGVIFWRRWKSM